MSILERRVSSRYLCADLVRVNWSAPEGGLSYGLSGGSQSGESNEAVLEDISALGACVQTVAPVPFGAKIVLSIGPSVFQGSVCYTVFRDDGYFIGIRFSEDTEWSSDRAMPKHLTNVYALALNSSR